MATSTIGSDGVKWIESNGVWRKSMEPWIKDSVEYYPHQVEGIRDLAVRNSFILGDDMGLGKSLQALTVFAIDVVRGWASQCLVVCPSTLKGNWADEVVKFTGFPAVVLEGNEGTRLKQLMYYFSIEGPKILIVNYEQVVSHQLALDNFRFDVAIFDECHYLKNPESKRTEACSNVYSRRSFMLSGTPMLNHVNELYVPLYRIGAYRKGYHQFKNRYCVMGGYKDKQIVGAKNEEELQDMLNRFMLRRLKKDVLNLPEVQIQERRVDLHSEQQKLYDEVLNELKLSRWDTEQPDDIKNALTRFLRLKQICGTTFPFDEKDISSKLDLVILDDIRLLEEGHKIIMFTQFRPVLACYAERMNRLSKGSVPVYQLHGDVPKPDRQPIVNQWSADPNPAVIACMLQVAGVGLNMTASRHMAFVDKLFVPGLNQQAIDRAHRIGQSETQPVQVREYIARNTIENRVNQILRTKKKVFGDIVEQDPQWIKKLVQQILEDEGAAAA